MGVLTMTDGNASLATIQGYNSIKHVNLQPVTATTSNAGVTFSSNTMGLDSAVSGSVYKVQVFGN